MGYEIPQKLQHKERIVFGLTFSQLGWALLFIFIVLIIFKLNLSLLTRFILAIIPSIIGVLFVFFDFNTFLRNIFNFLKFRRADLNDFKMSSFLGIKKISDNKVILNKGEIAILRIEPINFSIKTSEEKDSVIAGFQKFLNGLDFPVQFVVSTQDLNIDAYLDSLKSRIKNKKLFADFELFINNLISDNKMHNRFFYLVIPKVTDLGIQVDVCKERLQSIGLLTKRLNTGDLLNTFYDFFNDINDSRVLQESSNTLNYLIAPNSIQDNVDFFRVNSKFCRIISVVGYPRIVESGFLDKIISSTDDFDISIHVEPFNIATMMVNLNKEIQKQRADLYAEQKKNGINPTLEIKLKDTLKVLEELQKGNQKLFNVSLYINCKAKTKEDLDLLTKKVETELNSLMMIPSTPSFRQIQGYQSMIPISKDRLKIKRNITTGALSAFFPFTSPFLKLENKGVMLGLNKNGIPFIKDIFSLNNANGVVLATSGSGKSYFTKLLISRQLLNNTQVLIIDPQSEYIGLTQQVKGQLVTISRKSKTIINPLDLMGHDYIEKRLTLMDLFKIMFGELSEIQKSILDRAITETYLKKGISEGSEKDEPPILSDLYKTLNRMYKKAINAEKITYRALMNRLYMYTDGVFSFLNKQTSINFNNNFVCFNIGDMPKQVKPIVMFLILDFIYMRMKKSKQRKLLIIDEAWSLLGKTEEASYIFEIVKTCRKFNLGLLMITQDVEDLLSSQAGHAVLANSSYSLLLRQRPSVINQIVKTFHLSKMEKEYLLTATQGKGILIMDNEHQELSVVASPKEHKIITTNPDEIIQQETTIKPKNKVDIELDTEKGLFYTKKLSISDKNYLGNQDYLIGNFVPMGEKRQQECLVKRNKVESLEHAFLVYNIKQEIEKHKKQVERYIVEKPDLILKIKNSEFAIEIETGKSYDKNKKKLKNKFNNLQLEYGKKLFIVLTNKNYKRQYKNMFPNIKIYLRQDFLKVINTLCKTNKQTSTTRNI